MTALLLFTTLALANNVGSVRYAAGSSTSLPIEAGVIAGVDDMRTPSSKRILDALEVASPRTGYPVRRDVRCGAGAVGELTLVEYRSVAGHSPVPCVGVGSLPPAAARRCQRSGA